MGVSTEITEHLHRSSEGGFGIDYPVLPMDSPQELMEPFRIRQSGSWPRAAEAFASVETFQTGAELAMNTLLRTFTVERKDTVDAPSGCGPETGRLPERRSG